MKEQRCVVMLSWHKEVARRAVCHKREQTPTEGMMLVCSIHCSFRVFATNGIRGAFLVVFATLLPLEELITSKV